MHTVVALPSRAELRRFVREVLCERDRLEPQSTPLFESLVWRSNRTCGLFFEVRGPRLLRGFAVWAGEEHRILFYDSIGQRFAEVHLSDEPDPAQLDTAEPQAA